MRPENGTVQHSTRIVTVTPNPSLDRTIELGGELQRGAVQRAVRTTAEPGGKGVNVSRVVVASGGDTLAVLPGDELDPVLLGLATRGIPTLALPIGAPLRSNVTVTEPTGTTTKLNEPGPSLAGRLDDLAALVADAAGPTPTGPAARWVVLAGSLPPGLPDDALAVLVRAVRRRHGDDVRIAVDSSGVPFTALLQSGERIDLVKPNAEELAEVVGGDPDVYEQDPDAAVAAAHRLRHKHVDTVLLTLGSAGAVLVSDEGAFAAAAPRIVARSTVGAGDSSLAGYLLAEVAGATPAERLPP
ncbi:1-phosphofructokinase family hexose kinase, partial [Curtobacterium sp. ER1/6]|uniref:1-phosphofructokinase family hexose kinase n=1 Tax=Curtobacterium sp. ER1/6 TaxID=1891920 RepID=UPI00084FB3DB